MSKKKKKGKGNGLGPWQEHGAMARKTITPNKKTRIERKERQQKQKGWD